MRLTSGGEFFEDKLEKMEVKEGSLLEFKNGSEGIMLAVAQKPDGKNWMVYDQNGVTSSIKLNQITFLLPGIDNFDPKEIPGFIQQAHNNLDPTLLQFAWVKLFEKNESITEQGLAEIIFGSMEPLDIYCAHLLLSRNNVYFTMLESHDHRSVYGPRSTVQVKELLHRKVACVALDKEFEDFVKLLKSAKSKPMHAKPAKSSWSIEEKIKYKIDSLEAYAIDAWKSDEQRKIAGMILKSMGLLRTASSAVNLLIDIGYFSKHVNLDLLKFNIRTEHSDETTLAAESLMQVAFDQDEVDRRDLSDLTVYAIDVDEANELDDALSATRLQDGRIKVWIHVADPTSLVQPGSILEREAMKRGLSIFLPTVTHSMFPDKLAMNGMSLKQGIICRAVTVAVVLYPDGSISEYAVENSLIRPTHMLTYERACELLHLNLREEIELCILFEAAELRSKWRQKQGAVGTATLEARIKVPNPEDPKPSIHLYVENQSNPAMLLVSEMMLLCGEVIATVGFVNNIPLPYRGHPQSDIDMSAFSHLPEGPVRTAALVKVMRGAEMDFRKPIRHGLLGLPGYVQFTSPIRRYIDLLAHYQIKACLRGDPPPFSTGQIEGKSAIVNMQVRLVKKLSATSLRYWTLEFLSRQPKKKVFRALILQFIKHQVATLLLIEVGFQASAWVCVERQVGDEIAVFVEEANPRDDYISLKEVISP